MFRKIAVLVSTPLLLAAACASEGDGDAVQVNTAEAAISSLQAAPDAVADAGTGKLRMVMEMTVMGEPLELVATGAYDVSAQQMAMSMDMGAMFEQMAAAAGEEIPLELGDGVLEMVADGDTVYMRSSLFEMFAGTRGWLSLRATDLSSDAGSLGLGAAASDPTKILESLRGVTSEPEVVGQEDVDGVETTHYRATLSLADALAEVPESQRAEVEAALGQLGRVGDAEVPVDVWIDGEGLPRRMTLDMGAAFGAIAGEAVGATMTIELFDYGQPVDIAIPPADEVTPFSDVMAGLGSFESAS
jgi:hypothetical protein